MILQTDVRTAERTDGKTDGRGYYNIPTFSLKSAGINKMQRPLLIVSQSDCMVQVVDTNLHF